MKKKTSPSQRAVNNIRKRTRQDMERLALTHRGCGQARGCGCLVDRALNILTEAEMKLFLAEIDSYADPMSPRRIVTDGNEVVIVEDGSPEMATKDAGPHTD